MLLYGRAVLAAVVVLSAPKDDRTLDRQLRQLADSAGFSGVVRVERAGRLLFERAYIPRGRPTSLTAASAFWFASTTKQFTAAAIMKLVDEGKLAVTDSLSSFFRRLPRDARDITIDQLLTHTSGIAPSNAADNLVDRDAAVRAILAEPLKHAPGEAYHYEDEDYTILAAIVEVVSGKPFETFVERSLLIPAGLTHTGFCGRLAPTVKVAPSALGDAPPPCTSNTTPVDWADRGATGLLGTAADLLKWAHALRSGRVLSRASVEALERGHVLVRHEGGSEVYYSYGARIYMDGQRRREVWHSGYDIRVGQSSTVRLLDSGLEIVVLANSGLDASGQPWAAAVARAVEPHFEDSLLNHQLPVQRSRRVLAHPDIEDARLHDPSFRLRAPELKLRRAELEAQRLHFSRLSTIGVNVQRMPAARVSLAANACACSSTSGSHGDAIPSGAGNSVR